MHEFSLIADLLKKIESICQEQNAKKVVQVNVKLGALAHISAEHFREHFVAGVKNSKAEGTQLHIEVSDDTNDPHAQDIVLESVEVT